MCVLNCKQDCHNRALSASEVCHMVIRREGSDNQMLLYAILDESFARDVGQHCTLSISAGDGISLAAEAVGFTLEPVLQTLLSYRLITSSPQLIPMSSARLVSS